MSDTNKESVEKLAAAYDTLADAYAGTLRGENAAHTAEVLRTIVKILEAEANRFDTTVPAAYMLGLMDSVACIGHITQTEDVMAITALPTPTAADLVARLKGKNDE